MNLKTGLITGLFILSSYVATAQTVQKIKVTELAAYIAKSDSVLVVNFWATFCKPCVEEMPYINKVCTKYKGQKVKLVFVSLDVPADYPVKVNAFVKKHKFAARALWLNEIDADYFCPRVDKKWSGSIPATLIVNSTKNYRAFYEEPFTEAAFEKVLQAAL